MTLAMFVLWAFTIILAVDIFIDLFVILPNKRRREAAFALVSRLKRRWRG